MHTITGRLQAAAQQHVQNGDLVILYVEGHGMTADGGTVLAPIDFSPDNQLGVMHGRLKDFLDVPSNPRRESHCVEFMLGASGRHESSEPTHYWLQLPYSVCLSGHSSVLHWGQPGAAKRKPISSLEFCLGLRRCCVSTSFRTTGSESCSG